MRFDEFKDPPKYPLQRFRQFKSGANVTPTQDFGDEKISDYQKTGAANTNSKVKNAYDTPQSTVDWLHDFEQSSKKRGYQPKFTNKDSAFVFTSNNIRVNLVRNAKGVFQVQIHNLNPEINPVVVDSLSEFPVKTTANPRDVNVNINETDPEAAFEKVWGIVNSIESLGKDFKPTIAKGAGAAITKEQNALQYYRWIAENIYNSVKFNYRWGFSRGGGEGDGGAYDKNDALITVGITRKGFIARKNGDATYREHTVPADLINAEGIRICQEARKGRLHSGQTIAEVMDMIQKNLMIVICTPDEAAILDRDMGWQTTMPSGWKFGDSPLARFEQAEYEEDGKMKKGIPVFNIHDGKRLAENFTPIK